MVADYICHGALTLWGEDAQLDMVIEEMAELTKAILKYKRCSPADKGAAMVDIAEEHADVNIMLDQLYFIMCKNTSQSYHGDKIHFRDEKIKRLCTLLDEAELERVRKIKLKDISIGTAGANR
jgi:NTP pyrophosphatase (non-canonical NTP hydrolase)